MQRLTEFFVRLGGAFVGFTLFGTLTRWIFEILARGDWGNFSATSAGVQRLADVAGIVGLIVGFLFAVQPIQNALKATEEMESARFGSMVAGSLVGLIAAALLSVPLRTLPAPFGGLVPTLVAVPLIYLGVRGFAGRTNEVSGFFEQFRPKSTNIELNQPAPPAVAAPEPATVVEEVTKERTILLDTSVIIDGRITDITKTGFISGELLVPNFVLLELQHIADNPDPIRRKRGRRGLEVLNVLQTECPVDVRFENVTVSDSHDVDSKLVSLAKKIGAPIMTNDYNLNRVANLQGVSILNVNDLANAVKAAFLPGEELSVKIIQEGREVGQGVGYLDDGTMVVVEDGVDHLNEMHRVMVTKVLQTTAGRMIFARFSN